LKRKKNRRERKKTEEIIKNPEIETAMVEIEQTEESNEAYRALKIISQINNLYTKGVVDYQNTISNYNIEIYKLKNKIELKTKEIAKEKEHLTTIENELFYESKTFDTLDYDFEQKINSIKDLKFEYKSIMSSDKYDEVLKRKHRELDEILDKIEDKERLLLNKELERLNLEEEELKPKQDVIEVLNSSLYDMENEKKHFEFLGLNKTLNPNTDGKNTLYMQEMKLIEENVIDNRVS